MSRLTIGYFPGKGLDILSDNIMELRDSLMNLRDDSHVEFRAWFGMQFHRAALYIEMEGDLSSIEHTLDDVVDEWGLPNFACSRINYIRLSRLKTKWHGPEKSQRTTFDAYELMRKKYASEGVKKTTALVNMTFVPSYNVPVI